MMYQNSCLISSFDSNMYLISINTLLSRHGLVPGRGGLFGFGFGPGTNPGFHRVRVRPGPARFPGFFNFFLLFILSPDPPTPPHPQKTPSPTREKTKKNEEKK
ncbi:unnamed protein product [Cuscuta epithymum]|uniref:Uncharacterized protein n=1 Tax=Cuscuta epithymum TaxID=186058 RepID=A0AAV0FEG0_9ASTE|nr:unnamed protein product [Cuscuta epithymum]